MDTTTASHVVLAARLGDVAAVERLLRENPASAYTSEGEACNPMQVAASAGNVAVAQCIFKYGGEQAVAVPSKGSGMTPLMFAAAAGHTEVVDFFLQVGADTAAEDRNGWTALHHAAFKGQCAACECLLTRNAAVNAKTARNETPLAVAALLEHAEVCKVLLQYGAEVGLLVADSDKAFVGQVMADLAEAHKDDQQDSMSEYSADSAFAGQETKPAARTGASKAGKLQPRVRPQSAMSGRKQVLGEAPVRSPGKGGVKAAKGLPSAAMTAPGGMFSGFDGRSPPYAISQPAGPRRASPMYVPASGSTGVELNSAVAAALQAQPQGDAEWLLQAFSYRGVQEGFLLDSNSGLVYWMEPSAPAKEPSMDGRAAASAQMAGSPGRSLRPNLPVLVGKLAPGVAGYGNPSLGMIVPLSTQDCATVEMSTPALRCLRRQCPAAGLLATAARRGDPVAADLAPELGAAPYCQAVSLAVPLCAVLGVCEPSELSQLTPKDLLMADVDPAFLRHLLVLGEALPSSGLSSPAYSRVTPGSPAGSVRKPGEGEPITSLPTLPSLQSLIIKHGLPKLLPVAAEKRLLSLSELHRWGELGAAVAALPLTSPELSHLKQLMRSIQKAQEQALMLQASRMELLTKITVGSLVIYEAEPARAAIRGERLVGIVLEDLGPEVLAVNVTCKQYKVRDLLDDTMVWQSPGQLKRLNLVDGSSFLRADLLPPNNSSGAPVTPLSAAPGLPVHIAPWCKSSSILDDYQIAGCSAAEDGSDSGKKVAEDHNAALMAQVVGLLVEQVNADGTVWTVLWPDGVTRQHNVGAGGRFELVHMHLHRLAGAPLLRTHFALLLDGKDMLSVPVVRSPMWHKSTTDDSVPGSPGLGFIDAAQAAVCVVWSRSRDAHLPMYCPDPQGTYPLCHGLLGGAGISCFSAKPGVQVEPAPDAPPAVIAAAAQGHGTLVMPVAYTAGRVTWRVRWACGAVTLHDLKPDHQDAELQVCEQYMIGSTDRVVLLNEVSQRARKGGAVPAQAAAAALSTIHHRATAGATGGGFFSGCCCGCGSGGACRKLAALGRPLWAKDPAKAHHWGMLGSLVKLNLSAIALQPGCEQGPLVAYEPMPLAEMYMAKKEGTLGLIPRDDVGIVVKDAGPGTWRSLLVRKLGSTQSFWYDESVLLPATPDDVKKQVLRCGPSYTLPRHLQGVPVTDATAAPGMLVQRAFVSGAAQEFAEQALIVGQLLAPAGPHAWQVVWPDGRTGVYKTGASNKFQLCYVNLGPTAGAPLQAATVTSLASMGVGAIPVTDGLHSAAGALQPGAVRYVNGSLTQQELLLHERAQLQATGMVVTSLGERCVAGGPLRLYELSHAIVAGDAVTVFNAKRGMRVTVVNDEAEPASGEAPDSTVAPPPPRTGVLLAPTRLIVRAIIDAGSGGGSGKPGGGTPSRDPVLVQDPASVFWEVEWANGRVEELMIGTLPSHTPLRVLTTDQAALDEAAEDTEHANEEAEDAQKAPNYFDLAKSQHFVRMLEPVMLLPCKDVDTAWALERMAQPLHRAISWFNQLQRELCGAWWASACLAAACASAEAAAAAGDDIEAGAVTTQLLWRPHVQAVTCQPDLLSALVRKRPAGLLRWQTLNSDEDGQLADRLPIEMDTALAASIQTLTSTLIAAGSGNTAQDGANAAADGTTAELANVTVTALEAPSNGKHVIMDTSGRFLEDEILLDDGGRPQAVNSDAAAVLQAVNTALAACRTALRGDGLDSEAPMDPDMDHIDLTLSLEPAMWAVAPPVGGSATLSLVKQKAPGIDAFIASCLAQDNNEEGEQGGSCGEDNRIPVGPVALLLTGYQTVVNTAVLQTHRALGALASVSGTMGAASSQNALLRFLNRQPCSTWVEVSEELFPVDVGQARCLALINSQLFLLRKMCACLNGCEGGGTANASGMLMGVLKVVRAKAQAAFALEAGRSLVQACRASCEDASNVLEEQSNLASDIKAFDHNAQQELLKKVGHAMQQLSLSEIYGQRACGYAEKAHPLATVPGIGLDEKRAADDLEQEAHSALSDSVARYNGLYPGVVDTVRTSALSLTSRMRQVLLQASTLFQDLKAAQQSLADARKQQDVAERSARTADDDYTSAVQAKERKDADTEKAAKNMEASKTALAEAEEQLKQTQEQDADPASAANVSAQAMVTEVQERVTKLTQAWEATAADAEKQGQVILEAEAVLKKRRAEASEAKNAAAKAQNTLRELNQQARTLDPGSEEALEEHKRNAGTQVVDRMHRQVQNAKNTLAAAVASLEALRAMQRSVPSCMQAPEAIDRYLARAVSTLALICAAAAAECARTSTLQLEDFLLDLEEQEQVAMTAAMLTATQTGSSVGGSFSVAARSTATMSATASGGGALTAIPGYVPALPNIDEVNSLMNVVRNDVWKSVGDYTQLLPFVPDETTITAEDGVVLNKAVLAGTIDRAMLTAASMLEKLGAAAALTVSSSVAKATASAGSTSTNAQQNGIGNGSDRSSASSAVEELPAALRAARMATLVAETCRIFPVLSTDMPTSDVKVGAQLVSLLRAAQNHNNSALKDCTKLSNEVTVKLSKSALGAAATSASVLCAAYADLGRNSSSLVESEYWCQESVAMLPKAKAAAQAAVAALAPPPPVSDGEGAEGEEDSEKRQENQAELAAKAAAAAEAERIVHRYMSEVSIKICQAAVDWASKAMSALSDTSSIEEISTDIALAAAAQVQAAAAAAATTVDESAAVETAPPPQAPHPDTVVQQLRALAPPLLIADMAFREAGNHTALDKLDVDIKDVLSTAAEAARMRAETCRYGMANWQEQQQELLGQGATGAHISEAVAAMDKVAQIAVGVADCSKQAVAAAQQLFQLVPLVLPEEKASRQIREAAVLRDEAVSKVPAMVQTSTDFRLHHGFGSVSGRIRATTNHSSVRHEDALAQLEPVFTQLEVVLAAAPQPCRDTGNSRPSSPSRRSTRIVGRRVGPSPPLFKLQLSISSPGERYNELCTRVEQAVFEQPSVRALLAPYHTLLQASNEAAMAVHAAAAVEPTDLEVDLLLNPDSPAAAAATLSSATSPTFRTPATQMGTAAALNTSATGGLEPSSANLLQMKRWGPAVANMSAGVGLVRKGFIEAVDACRQLEPLEVLWLPC